VKYLVSPHGLIHLVKYRQPRKLHGHANPNRGYWITYCGRPADQGWSQEPGVLRNPNSPYLCRSCRHIEEVRTKQT
jgi:hypothetical protein